MHARTYGPPERPAAKTCCQPCDRSRARKRSLLLAAAGTTLLLPLARDHLAQHDNTVAIHEGDARQTLAILEGVAHQGLLRLEAALGHFVGLQGVRVVHLLAAGLLAHLPLELRDAAGSPSAAHEADRRVANLDLIRDIEDLDLRVELTGLAQSGVLLIHHHISGSWHVVLVQTLDVQADIVAGIGEIDARMVHLDGEHLAGARIRSGVGRQEDHLLTWLHNTLLDAACQDISHALDLVDARDRHA